jgi:hypothetical protein
MSSSGVLRRVALVRTDVSEECLTSIIRVTTIVEIQTKLELASEARREEVRMVFIRSVLLMLVTSLHRDNGSDTFLRNIGCCNSHMA